MVVFSPSIACKWETAIFRVSSNSSLYHVFNSYILRFQRDNTFFPKPARPFLASFPSQRHTTSWLIFVSQVGVPRKKYEFRNTNTNIRHRRADILSRFIRHVHRKHLGGKCFLQFPTPRTKARADLKSSTQEFCGLIFCLFSRLCYTLSSIDYSGDLSLQLERSFPKVSLENSPLISDSLVEQNGSLHN